METCFYFAGDLTDDSTPSFTRHFHRALTCVCDELFLSRCMPATQTPSLASLFKDSPTEPEKHNTVEQLLNVKVQYDNDKQGLQFTSQRRQER